MSRKRYPAFQTRREIAEITKRESTFLRLHSLENPFRYLESGINHITLHLHPSGEEIKVYAEWLRRQPVFGFFSDARLDLTKLADEAVDYVETEINSQA